MKTKYFVIYSIIVLVFLSSAGDLISSKRSIARKESRKKAAIKFIKEHSEEVSGLAGLKPDTIQSKIENKDKESDQEDKSEAQDVKNTATTGEIQGDEGEILSELEQEDDVIVDFETFKVLWLSFVDEDEEDEYTETGIKKSEMMDEIMGWLGTPYFFSGDSRRSIDCSAFIRRVFRNVAEIELPRTSYYQSLLGETIPKEELKFGDLVFFKTRRYAPITHVGIYLADDLFAHASSGKGVTISSLNSSYYKRVFRSGKRITASELSKLENNFAILKNKN